MKRCPYCGDPVKLDHMDCPHCGQPLKIPKSTNDKKSSVDLDSWKEKSIPGWAMFVIIGLSLFCLWILISEGCKRANDKKSPPDETAYRIVDASWTSA